MQYGTLVRKALEEKKYHQEALRQQTITEVFAVLERLSQRVTFDQAFLFGSLVRPYTFGDHSDVDIGFVNLQDDQFFWVIRSSAPEGQCESSPVIHHWVIVRRPSGA